MDVLLVVNAGSSSLKFQVFELKAGRQLHRLLKGQVEGIGSKPHLRIVDDKREVLLNRTYEASALPDLPSAIDELGGWLRNTMKVNLVAVGHRVVHGGPDFAAPVIADASILARLEAYIPLAPLHQPHNLAVVRSILARRADVVQVLCFDTAFHRSHDALADHYGLPEALYDEGVRRYGFHGLSYEYVAGRLRDVAPELADGRVIIAHLGSGASMCAIAGGRSVESTMGFSALDGLPMGTRPGQLDPGAVLYLIGQKKMSVEQVQNLLYRDCGLKGLSGVSNDVRELESSGEPRAAFALEYFVYRIGLHVGMLAAALGGVDALVFTAGIGENSPTMRARITRKLEWLGAKLDAAANEQHQTVISSAESRLKVLVVPTDEELIIARHALALLPR